MEMSTVTASPVQSMTQVKSEPVEDAGYWCVVRLIED